MMDRCWLGETNFDFDHEQLGSRPNATAIQINGNDHYILNTIVFSSKIGLEVNGAADYITGAASVASLLAAVLTEIYLYGVRSCEEILRHTGQVVLGPEGGSVAISNSTAGVTPPSALLAMWETPFASDDLEVGGCPALL